MSDISSSLLGKLDEIARIKELIRQAIIEKKVDVAEDAPFESYRDRILEIGGTEIIPESEYLTFTSEQDGSEISMNNYGGNHPLIYYFSHFFCLKLLIKNLLNK